jgi:hypothetical protein
VVRVGAALVGIRVLQAASQPFLNDLISIIVTTCVLFDITLDVQVNMIHAENGNTSQQTVNKQRSGVRPSSLRNLRPFTKGDPRINRAGRPRTFEEFRKLAQKVLSETVTTKDGQTITRAEDMLRRWSKSSEPALQRALAEYAVGKVPEKLEATGLENRTTLVLHFAHERARVEAEQYDALPTIDPAWQPDGPNIAVNGEGTRRRLLRDADGET